MLAEQAYNVKESAMKETTPAARPPALINGFKDVTRYFVIKPTNGS
jgi:hypothetical protein